MCLLYATLWPTHTNHSLATIMALLAGCARFAVLSRLQEMQHYICLQPTGTGTRSCYMIKDWFPESVCGLTPPGFRKDWLSIGEQKWRYADYVQRGVEMKFEGVSFGFSGAPDFTECTFIVSSAAAWVIACG